MTREYLVWANPPINKNIKNLRKCHDILFLFTTGLCLLIFVECTFLESDCLSYSSLTASPVSIRRHCTLPRFTKHLLLSTGSKTEGCLYFVNVKPPSSSESKQNPVFPTQPDLLLSLSFAFCAAVSLCCSHNSKDVDWLVLWYDVHFKWCKRDVFKQQLTVSNPATPQV